MATYVFVKSGGTRSTGFATYTGAEDAWQDSDWVDAECYADIVAGMVPTIGQNDVTVVIDFDSYGGTHTQTAGITDNRWSGLNKVLRPRAASGRGTLQFGTTGLMFSFNAAGSQTFKRISITRSGPQTDNWVLMRIAQGVAGWAGNTFEDCVFGNYDWIGSNDLGEGLLFTLNGAAGETSGVTFQNCSFENMTINAAANDSRNMLGDWVGSSSATMTLSFKNCTFRDITKTSAGTAAGPNREGFFSIRPGSGQLNLRDNIYQNIRSTGDTNGHSAFWHQYSSNCLMDVDGDSWSGVIFDGSANAFGYDCSQATGHKFVNVSAIDCSSANANENNGTGGVILMAGGAAAEITGLTCLRVGSNYGPAVYCSAGGTAIIDGLDAQECEAVGGIVYFGGHGQGTLRNFKILNSVQRVNTLNHPGLAVYAHQSPTFNANSTCVLNLGRIEGGTPHGGTTNIGVYLSSNDTTNLNTFDVVLNALKISTSLTDEIEAVVISGAGAMTLRTYDLYLDGGSAAIKATGTGLTLTETRTQNLKNSTISLGLLAEETRTVDSLQCRDFTKVDWVKTNMTASLTATGIDNVVNSASALTATAANGQALQTITLASAARNFSIFVKRRTGVGAVQITDNGGTNWTTLADVNTRHWTRFDIDRTQANPVIGIRLATNGDAVDVDYALIESNSINVDFPTMPILTTATPETRNFDDVQITDLSWYNENAGTFFLQGRQEYPTSDSYFFELGGVDLNNRIYARVDGSNPYFTIIAAGVVQANIDLGTYNAGAHIKIAGAFAPNDVAAIINGGSIVTDASVVLPLLSTMNTLRLGGGLDTTRRQRKTLATFAYWNERKPNEFLESLVA